METRTVEVFRFAELGDSAKERARYEAQASGIWDFYAEEALESLFAFLRYFRAKLLDYRIDWTNCSHSYIRIDLPWYEEGEFEELVKGLRHDGSCQFTGVCYDYFLNEGAVKEWHKGVRLPDSIIDAGFREWLKVVQDEYEQRHSDECLSEDSVANDIWYTHRGEVFLD